MATLSLTGGVKKFSWTISGLGNNFNTTYYKSAGVTTTSFSDGASSVSSVSSVTASSSGTSKSVSKSNVSFTTTTGRITFYGYAQAANGNYYNSGSATTTITNASYTISSYTSTSITIKVTVDSNCSYCSAICRLTSDSSDGSWTTMTSKSGTWTYTFSGLTPNTSYTINVRCSPTSSTSYAVLLGAETQTTSAVAPSVSLSTTVLSHNAIRATFTYDSSYPYYRLRWKPSSSSSWTYSGSSYTSYSSTTNYSIGSLSTNTTYDIEVLVATSSSGANSSSGDTDSATTLPQQSANLSITSVGTTTVDGKVTIDSNYRYLQAVYREASTTTDISYYPANLTRRTGTTWSFQITNLSTDTDYVLNARGSVTGETSYAYNILSSGLPFYTLPTFTDVSATTNSITARISGLSSNYSGQRIIYMVVYLNGTEVSRKNQTINAGVTGSVDVTVTGLSPGTNYTVELSIYRYVDTTTYYMGSYSRSTDGVSITPWSWTSANSTTNPVHTAEATASQTTAARNACQNKTAVSNFSYKVWNDLVWKVSEARVAGGDSAGWNNYYDTRDNTLMTSSSKILTATRYNSLRYNIGTVFSVPTSQKIAEVSTGDTVGGTTHFLNFVTNYLNAYIDTLT